MGTSDILKVLAFGSCNFESFQNITRAHKSRNALAFIRFPILILVTRIKPKQKQSKHIVTRDCYKGYSVDMEKKADE